MFQTAWNNVQSHPLLINPIPVTPKHKSLARKKNTPIASSSSIEKQTVTPTVSSYWNHIDGEVWLDWKSYIAVHSDLSHILSRQQALRHFNTFGLTETRS